jgi:hypothetical protein
MYYVGSWIKTSDDRDGVEIGLLCVLRWIPGDSTQPVPVRRGQTSVKPPKNGTEWEVDPG